ncbi:MAG: hypothetical protein FWD82_06745 [Defluviitaleaceae bacterium]|nr:hypothetical protein [Defluviitaleaceae bacterium]
MNKCKVLRIITLITLIGFVIATPVFSQAATSKVLSVSYYVESENFATEDSISYPAIALYSNNTFTMIVNLYADMGKLTGTYQMYEDSYRFTVLSRDFLGFLGDNVRFFTMYIMDNGNLRYSGSQIGTTDDGSIFTYSSTVPASFY